MNTNKFPANTVTFEKAVPVWPFGREAEMNLWLSFRACARGAKKTLLRLTGSSAYTVKVGGKFVAFGPARCAHGFWRVDELDLTEYINGESVVTVDVATGTGVASLYLVEGNVLDTTKEFVCELPNDRNIGIMFNGCEAEVNSLKV